ncbi:MAG: DsbA family oxidoreductase [Gammaproteobacteria bacterium]|jgi:predicted DsbA family dithiol-disulfide isomerase|nr:DsbA family oxidoreductase [Gammaproteobacteria bacterium]MDH3757559.1 DsbA family oxidoreductase [Gammaproteobacteria bacterium]MDH3848561.1 DsbA family oxidoreductase [Gammaproteobacteria bacterium]MDH3862821.1 DsbA family oxidoreductase [Gammaproteobacteria bacterium]MDH3907295.1 DsbA family oxidoreductase [Gammaproteobacteria bacterium]
MSELLSHLVRTRGAGPDQGPSPAAALHVEVIADLVCPFCYIGKRRFDQAMQAVQGPSDISWYPYQLNPDMPEEGMSLHDYLSMRFGSPANVEPVLQQLAADACQEDIDFRFDRIEHVPNTLRAHQLMYLAETQRKDQSALAEELMTAFFRRGEDIGNLEILVELGGRHGLLPEDIDRVTVDESVRQIVLSREAQVRSSGIAGVPGFLLNRRLLVIGAQDTDALVNAFDRAMFGEGNDAIISPALH